MKYSIIFIISLLLSCSEPQVKSKVQNPSDVELVAQDSVIVEKLDLALLTSYYAFLQKLDKNKLASNLDAMMEFKRISVQTNVETNDSLYLHYRNFYQPFLERQQSILEGDTANFCILLYNDEKDVAPSFWSKMKAKRKKLQDNGIDIECSEGSPFIAENRTFLKQHFVPQLSPLMQSYLLQEFAENEKWLYEDAGIALPLNEVIDRIVWHENFEKQHPEFVMLYVSRQTKLWHQDAILSGSDNTPREEYQEEGIEKIELSPDFSKAYNYALKTYPKAEITKHISGMLKAYAMKDRKKVISYMKSLENLKVISHVYGE
jgi:hypothetical protein